MAVPVIHKKMPSGIQENIVTTLNREKAQVKQAYSSEKNARLNLEVVSEEQTLRI